MEAPVKPYRRLEDKGKRSPEFREMQRQYALARWQDPAYRAKQAKYDDPKHNRRARLGIPTGMNKEMAAIAWAEARAKTEVYIQKMADSGMITPVIIGNDYDEEVLVNPATGAEYVVMVPKSEEGMAALALKESVLAMLSPMNNASEKSAARRTVLEYTKSKPAQTIKAQVSHEQFLDELISNAKMIDGNAE